MKKLTFLICALMAFNMSIFAQNIIKLTWEAEAGNLTKAFVIVATDGKNFSIDWGDASGIETKTGVFHLISVSHTYSTAGTYPVTISSITEDSWFRELYCSDSQLTSLDVSGCTVALWLLDCRDNQLTSLNVSGCTALSQLFCENNQLTSIDASGCTELGALYCNDNQLTSLNVSGCTKLGDLRCNNNQLTSLDVNGCSTALYHLWCGSNQITSLDVSGCTELRDLSCGDNQLTLSELFLASELLKNNIANMSNRQLGTQILAPRTVSIDVALFSDQAEFNDIYTEYSVSSGTEGTDYTVTGGTITFLTAGNYTVTMTNAAIISYSSYPAKAIIDITVEDNVGIDNYELGIMNYVVYPNPTTGKITVKCAETLRATSVQMFDVVGKVVGTYSIRPENMETVIDVSQLQSGVYVLKIGNYTSRFVKE